MPRFFIKNKFVRLITNIVCIPLWWMLINLILAQFSPESIDISLLPAAESRDQAYMQVALVSLSLLALYGLIMLVPPFWLTWYLWMRKRGPKIK